MLECKLHRVTVTHSELDHEGSCAVDTELMAVTGIPAYEQAEIYNITNGERFFTYATKAEPGSGIISVNGAAAHKATSGDLIIIAACTLLNEQELKTFKPTLVYAETKNNVTHTDTSIPILAVS